VPDSPVHKAPMKDCLISSAAIHHPHGLTGHTCSSRGCLTGSKELPGTEMEMKQRGNPDIKLASAQQGQPPNAMIRRVLKSDVDVCCASKTHDIATHATVLVSTVRLTRNQPRCDSDGRAEPNMAQSRVAPG
jgi:hypothetical protein